MKNTLLTVLKLSLIFLSSPFTSLHIISASLLLYYSFGSRYLGFCFFVGERERRMAAAASLGAANTAVLKEVKIEIGSFDGLRSWNPVGLSRRRVNFYPVSSSTSRPNSLIKAVSTVRFLPLPFFFLFMICFLNLMVKRKCRKNKG
jgi:hypothetical protein